MIRVWLCAIVLVADLASSVPTASADGALPGAVTVACPDLGAEPQSALAARAEADLLVRGTAARLAILCAPGSATLRFVGVDGAERQAVLPLPPDPREATERILEALDELLPRPPSSAEPTAAPPPPVLAPLPPAQPTPAPPPTLPPAAGGREAQMDWDRARVELGVGVETELWSSEAFGAAGPRLGLSWAPEPLWALRVAGGPSWGLRAPEDVSGYLLRVEVGAELRIGPRRSFRLAATVLGDRLAAGSDEQSTAALAFGGALRASYGAWLGDVRLSGGPLLLVHPGAVRVELGTRELFRIPAVTAGLGVEVSVAPWDGP